MQLVRDSSHLTCPFSWRDEFGQAGAASLSGSQLPYALPSVEGELCDLRLISLSWQPGQISGSVDSDCVTTLKEPVELQNVSGHANLNQTALLASDVTAVTGTLTVEAGVGRRASRSSRTARPGSSSGSAQAWRSNRSNSLPR